MSKPFYVDVEREGGYKTISIKCASNNFPVQTMNGDSDWYEKQAHEICDRMNKEAEGAEPTIRITRQMAQDIVFYLNISRPTMNNLGKDDIDIIIRTLMDRLIGK